MYEPGRFALYVLCFVVSAVDFFSLFNACVRACLRACAFVRQIRNQAYQKLTNEFKMAESEKSKVYKEYIPFFKKVI